MITILTDQIYLTLIEYAIISTSNRMFGKAIWDKLSECILENVENARVKRRQFQNYKKSQR